MHDERSPSMASLVRAIHAAGIDAGHWRGVLERLREELNASVVTIGHHEFATGADIALYESPDDLQFSRDFAAYAARNPWYLSSDEYVAGRVMTGDDVVSDGYLKRTDFYRDFLRPRGLLHRLCGVVAQRGSRAYLLSAYRREDHGAFGATDKDGLRALLGHVTLSLETQWRWQEADDLAHALMALSDRDDQPMILVTAQGEAVYRNPAAELLLVAGDGLRLDGERVVASSPADQRVLREAIEQVAPSASASAGAAPRVVALAGRAGAAPLVVVVRAAGLVFATSTGARRGLALVIVRGGHAVHDAGTCAFAREYQLTATQAKVSALIYTGQPLMAIAQTLRVSENTVRSHLRLVFQKTDTHSRMELVHLHARFCASMP